MKLLPPACSKCQARDVRVTGRYANAIHFVPGRRGQKKAMRAGELRCAQCGHTGWSKHPDVAIDARRII